MQYCFHDKVLTEKQQLLCTRKTDIDIITYGHVFLYTAVFPDTYWFTQERTVWPYDALNQREGADKLRSIWSPNGPHDPLSLQQYLPGISRCWFGQGSCTASPPRSHLYHAHVTKRNTEIEADVTVGHCRRNGSRSVKVRQQQVKFAVLCKICVLTAMIAFHRLCFHLSAFVLERRTPKGVLLWLQNF